MADSRDLKASSPWADLVIAMLSVNSFPLERTFTLFDQLEANGLLDLRNLATLKHPEIFIKLVDSGYKRGDAIVGMLTVRLLSLAELAADIEANELILTDGTEKEIGDLLSKVHGVGPVVLRNFFTLRGKPVERRA